MDDIIRQAQRRVIEMDIALPYKVGLKCLFSAAKYIYDKDIAKSEEPS